MSDDQLRNVLTDAVNVFPVAPPSSDRLVRAIGRARKRRTNRRRAAAAVVVMAGAAAIAAVTFAGGGGPSRHVNVVGSSSVPTTPPAVTSSVPATSEPTAPVTVAPKMLHTVVESDAQMKASGNDGPSSSILSPQSCVQHGTIVTATGSYTNGGFAPNVYNRYGDVVELYVYDASGAQLAMTNTEDRPAIGGYGNWTVTAELNSTTANPAECVVAAQPTPALQLAP
jgi:hypothetical protein